MNLYNYLKASLDNSSDGASGKKITAFIITITYVYSHRYVTTDILTGVLVVDAGLISALFGLNVIDKLKNRESDA